MILHKCIYVSADVPAGNSTVAKVSTGIVQAGLFQFNVVVPSAGTGDQTLQATVNGASTPSNVYITLQ